MEKISGTIKGATRIKEHEGQLQIGFLLTSRDDWFNIKGDQASLDDMAKIVKSDNDITFDFDPETKAVTNIIVKPTAKPIATSKPSSEKSGKWEDEMISFEDLLTQAHDMKTKFSIETENIQLDTEKKFALFRAEITTGDGRKFVGHGDASPDNVKSQTIMPHYIRMAETRAIVRALRWFTNNAKCSQEETDGEK